MKRSGDWKTDLQLLRRKSEGCRGVVGPKRFNLARDDGFESVGLLRAGCRMTDKKADQDHQATCEIPGHEQCFRDDCRL